MIAFPAGVRVWIAGGVTTFSFTGDRPSGLVSRMRVLP